MGKAVLKLKKSIRHATEDKPAHESLAIFKFPPDGKPKQLLQILVGKFDGDTAAQRKQAVALGVSLCEQLQAGTLPETSKALTEARNQALATKEHTEGKPLKKRPAAQEEEEEQERKEKEKKEGEEHEGRQERRPVKKRREDLESEGRSPLKKRPAAQEQDEEEEEEEQEEPADTGDDLPPASPLDLSALEETPAPGPCSP